MNTWHNRLQCALDAREKTWPDLVRATGLSKPSVYAWKPGATKRTKMMDGNHASAVCAWLKISSVWLFDNKGPSGLDDDLLLSSNTNGLKIEAESVPDGKHPAGIKVRSFPDRRHDDHPAIAAVVKLMLEMDDVGKGRVLQTAAQMAELHAKTNPESSSQ